MDKFYQSQLIDVRFQVDHVNPQKIQLFEEERGILVINQTYTIKDKFIWKQKLKLQLLKKT